MEVHKVGDVCLITEGPYAGLTCIVISEMYHVLGLSLETGRPFDGPMHEIKIEGVDPPPNSKHYGRWPGIIRRPQQKQPTTTWESCVWMPTSLLSKRLANLLEEHPA